MSRIIRNGRVLECIQDDIARQTDIDAVVNAANAQLQIGGGVAGALHRAAGPGLAEECASMAPLRPGQAVISGGHGLPNPYVIHCLGPVYGQDEPSERLLEDCYRNAVRLAESHRLRSVAFPALSTGAFGYPMEDAAHVAFRTLLREMPKLEHVALLRFVLFSQTDLELHTRALEAINKEDANHER
ncbi:MAG: macro domain-containing protein [Gammaproteobacteria bacterium]|nr:MAG: macro domain-containing protein [Gammaproteobacteria bacterium]